MKMIELNFAPLADSLDYQLGMQDLTCDDKLIEKFEKIKNSINMLYFHGYINDSAKDKCFKKLFKEIQSKVKLKKLMK